MAKVIKMGLSTKSINDAIKELKAFRDSLEGKKDKLLKELGEIGVREASVRFTRAMYDGDNHPVISLETTNNGYVIMAKGKAVAFIEFGAGVYYNGSESYPGPRPDGIVGIGEYGKGYGKRNTWVYRDEQGYKVFTHGNPAAMPMWYASEEMRSQIETIARRVFG